MAHRELSSGEAGGPLTGRVPSDWIAFATSWHSGWGKKLTLGIIVLLVSFCVMSYGSK